MFVVPIRDVNWTQKYTQNRSQPLAQPLHCALWKTRRANENVCELYFHDTAISPCARSRRSKSAESAHAFLEWRHRWLDSCAARAREIPRYRYPRYSDTQILICICILRKSPAVAPNVLGPNACLLRHLEPPFHNSGGEKGVVLADQGWLMASQGATMWNLGHIDIHQILMYNKKFREK